jgi:hypothetical protein
MKQRLLVMNGQRLLQTERDGEWIVSNVSKAGVIKPGIYNLGQAIAADTAKHYEGPVLHADREHLFQLAGKLLVKHDLKKFETAPNAGSNAGIQYVDGKAQVTQSLLKLGRGVRR